MLFSASIGHVWQVPVWISRRFYRVTTALVPRRNELPFILNRRGLLGTAVEIGVQQGLFSDLLLNRWAGRRLISIDPWQQSDNYDDIANVLQQAQDQLYEETLSRLATHGDRSEVWRQTAAEASAAVDAASLDFVYIDARHDYASVKDDLLTWYGKLRPGGIIAGHDYLDGEIPEGDFGVKSAVDEFFGQKRLRIGYVSGQLAVVGRPETR